MYAVEVCLLGPLPTIFTPEKVLMLDEKTITLIAGESEESMAERDRLTKKLAILTATQKVLHRLDRHKPIGRCVPACKSSMTLTGTVAAKAVPKMDATNA